jgi:hypothetical protein
LRGGGVKRRISGGGWNGSWFTSKSGLAHIYRIAEEKIVLLRESKGYQWKAENEPIKSVWIELVRKTQKQRNSFPRFPACSVLGDVDFEMTMGTGEEEGKGSVNLSDRKLTSLSQLALLCRLIPITSYFSFHLLVLDEDAIDFHRGGEVLVFSLTDAMCDGFPCFR